MLVYEANSISHLLLQQVEAHSDHCDTEQEVEGAQSYPLQIEHFQSTTQLPYLVAVKIILK